jgi:ankyrin repeat protein
MFIINDVYSLELLRAAEATNWRRVEELLQQNVDVNKSHGGAAALHYAMRYRNLDTAQKLIERGANVNLDTSDASDDTFKKLIKILI